MKLLTANRLSDGITLWWASNTWAEDGAKAVRIDDEAAEALLAEWRTRETEVVAPYLIPLSDKGMPVQREHVREFIRANGPSIGPTADALSQAFRRADIFED